MITSRRDGTTAESREREGQGQRALVFDSGVGGLSVADAMIAADLPLTLDYLADAAWLPYGGRPEEAVAERVCALLSAASRSLAPDLIVIACNTASTAALQAVRAAVTIPVIGVVPPIKPARAVSRTGAIGLLATPATIARAYTERLIADFAGDALVIRFGSTALVEAAEAKLAGGLTDPGAIAAAIEGLFGAPGGDRIDAVALACTHFPLLREELAAAPPRPVAWLESRPAIARRAATLLNLAPAPGGARAGRAIATAPMSPLPFLARGFSPPECFEAMHL